MQQRRQIERSCFCIPGRWQNAQEIRAADHLVHRAETKPRHELAHFFRDEEEIVHHMLGLTRKLRSQVRVLRCDADGTRVEMTLPHHHASFDDQRRGGKAKLIGAEQRSDNDVASTVTYFRLLTNAGCWWMRF
jgi:hypothetical protein